MNCKGMSVNKSIDFQSVIKCPMCNFEKSEKMLADACQYFYKCSSCDTLLKPKQGDCCVFCSYGSMKCPSQQQNTGCFDGA